MNSSENTINITVSFRGTSHPISLSSQSTIGALQSQLEDLTFVPSSLQKLLYKGKKAGSDDQDVLLSRAGIKDGMKVQMLGVTSAALADMKAAENEKHRVDKILRERALKAPVKVRNTGGGSSAQLNFRFHDLLALDYLPNPDAALSLLRKLSEDPAILHVMRKHEFSVGLLTELAPHEYPNLLGVNHNMGQKIQLRLRTNAYDGFRLYREIRRTLCHELSHNVWGEHDQKFKALNSQLNREVSEYESSVAAGTHRLGGSGDFYDPEDFPVEAHSFVLGGSSSSSNETLGDRRQRMLEATLARLSAEEEALEQILESTGCGTGGNLPST